MQEQRGKSEQSELESAQPWIDSAWRCDILCAKFSILAFATLAASRQGAARGRKLRKKGNKSEIGFRDERRETAAIKQAIVESFFASLSQLVILPIFALVRVSPLSLGDFRGDILLLWSCFENKNCNPESWAEFWDARTTIENCCNDEIFIRRRMAESFTNAVLMLQLATLWDD